MEPPEAAPTHPVVQAIVRELEIDEGQVILPAARFDHWAETLPVDHPRARTPELYGQLVALALELAQRKAPAAAQLYALSSLGPLT